MCEKFSSTNYLKTKKRARTEQQLNAHRFDEKSVLYAAMFHTGTRVSLSRTYELAHSLMHMYKIEAKFMIHAHTLTVHRNK